MCYRHFIAITVRLTNHTVIVGSNFDTDDGFQPETYSTKQSSIPTRLLRKVGRWYEYLVLFFDPRMRFCMKLLSVTCRV
jgi:hypothetical protein